MFVVQQLVCKRLGLHRTITRSLVAQAQGRTPGKPGRICSTVKASGTLPVKLTIVKKPAASGQKKNNKLCAQVYKKPAMKQSLALLEVCAYRGSSLSHAFAKAGQAAVRIAHRKQKCHPAKPGPEPVIRVSREGL